MKLKKWLKEFKNLSYKEYKNLEMIQQAILYAEHQQFCRIEQKEKQKEFNHQKHNLRPITEEEKKKLDLWIQKEKERHETSLKNGGLDEKGNYTALHHR